MQRRLNLALALVHDPDLVILDEPEAGLDPQSRVRVRDIIRSLARRKTVILTTHNMDEAERVADRVAIIDRSELLVVDTPQALKRRLREGDVLEIKLDGQTGELTQLCAALELLPGQIKASNGQDALSIRGLDLINHMAAILEAVRKAGYPCGEVRLRTNTLEDVFLELTGRRLRE
jgi:ABC-2 type transport system ATP-binding protein